MTTTETTTFTWPDQIGPFRLMASVGQNNKDWRTYRHERNHDELGIVRREDIEAGRQIVRRASSGEVLYSRGDAPEYRFTTTAAAQAFAAHWGQYHTSVTVHGDMVRYDAAEWFARGWTARGEGE